MLNRLRTGKAGSMSQVVEIALEQASFQTRQALGVAETAFGKAEAGDYFAQPLGRTRSAPKRAGMIVTAYRAARARVMADDYGNNAIKSAAVQKLQEMAGKAFDGLSGSLDRDLATVRKSVAAPAMATTAADRAAWAAEAARIWERCKTQLAAGVDLGTLVERADWNTVNVLAEEVNAWYVSQMPNALATADQMTKAAMIMIDARRYVLADATERGRLDFVRECDKGEYFARMAINHARYGLDSGVAVTLPDWDGSTFTAG
jgi:hypothetical protein